MLLFFQSFAPQNNHLAEILIIGRVVPGDVFNSGKLGFHHSWSSVGRPREALFSAVRTVDGKVHKSETMTMGDAVREQTLVEHLYRDWPGCHGHQMNLDDI